MEKQGHWNEIIALGQEHQLTFSSLFVEVPLFQGGGRGKGIYFQLCIKEAGKGFFGCYSVCETMKDTKEGYFIM